MRGGMLRHQCVQPLGIFPHPWQVSFLDGALECFNLPAKISQGGVAQDVAPIAYQFFRMANKQPGMFDRSRAEHAAKATRSLRISNGNRLPAAETSIPAVFHRKSILSALLAVIFLSFFGTRVDVPTKLRLALQRHLPLAFTPRQSQPLSAFRRRGGAGRTGGCCPPGGFFPA